MAATARIIHSDRTAPVLGLVGIFGRSYGSADVPADRRGSAQSDKSGALKRGAQLPTELQLREQYDASRNTIRDAIKRLTSLNLVETRPGQGTFVVKKVDPFVTTLSADPETGFGGGEGATFLSEVGARHRKPRHTVPKVEVQAPSDEIALRLRVPSGAQAVSRHQERYIDDIPWSLQTSFYPFEFVTSGKAPMLLMAQDIQPGVVELP